MTTIQHTGAKTAFGLDSLRNALPVFGLLNPRNYARLALLSLGVGLSIAMATQWLGQWPFWTFTAIVLVALLPVGLRKWSDDKLRYGVTVMLLSVLLTAQGVHTIEHIVQWLQYHAAGLTPRQSNGLVSAANAEWVHFFWNWAVLIVVTLLIRGGMRSALAWALFAVAAFHAVEHTYATVQHLLVLSELRQIGVTSVTAQGLPGILGRNGWLARSPLTQGTFLCTLPGLTTAVRLDVHFWWNVIETVLLLGAGNVFLARLAHK